MLEIMGKRLDVDGSELLYAEPMSERCFATRWEVHGGEWRVDGEWLTGRNPGNCPGMAFLKEDFPGDVMLDFEGRTVPPCTHDIDFMWNGSWDAGANRRGTAYVGGIAGWWTGKVGVERSPEYKLNAMTPLLGFEPGRTYHIQGGSVKGHCFIFIDGRLAIEMTDPEPIDSRRFAKVGFEAYCSHIQVRRVRVVRLKWEAFARKYEGEG